MLGIALSGCLMGACVLSAALVAVRERRYSVKLEAHVRSALQARYLHPEVLSASLSDLEDTFPDLAPSADFRYARRPGSFTGRCVKGGQMKPGWHCSRAAGHDGPCAMHPPHGPVLTPDGAPL